jgi:hypothetical protein
MAHSKMTRRCSEWLIDNNISLHIEKTLYFYQSKKFKTIDDFQINCNGHLLKSQSRIKYLGNDIEQHLSCQITISTS